MADSTPQREWMTTLLLALFLGSLGVHRFYTGYKGSAIAQLLTLGGCGLWSLYDLITIITGSYKDAEGRPLIKNN
ncbi:MAG: TM2 domain-containing protein [Leptospirales bacterium]|nr:TM2 domain-containing protein [Leptospirales bacterium]